jgi:protein tyrosine phosphatase (PTP) superfamily phosphohydrolase (DUF442 family)
MTRSRKSPATFFHPSIALALVLLTVASAAVFAHVPAVPGVSIENFGKVNDHYYRGSQPDHEQFAELKRLGIKTVIDLRKDNKAFAEEWVLKLGMKYFRIPLKAGIPATEKQTSYFLSLVNDPSNWPVYVHCKGGRHRTGADQAYREMKEYDFNNGLFGGPGAQKKFVYAFYEHFHATATAEQK